MSAWLIEAMTGFASVLAQTNPQDEGGGGWLLLAGPAAGVAVYTMLFRYYRNTDKSHSYERETTIEAKPITGSDVKVNEVRGTRQREIHGNNMRSPRARVQRVKE